MESEYVETKHSYFEVARSKDGQAIVGVYVTLQHRMAILFKTPEFPYIGNFPSYYASVANTKKRAILCRNEETLVKSICCWLLANKVTITLGKNIYADTRMLREKMEKYHFWPGEIPALVRRFRVRPNRTGIEYDEMSVMSFNGMNIVDGGVITPTVRNNEIIRITP